MRDPSFIGTENTDVSGEELEKNIESIEEEWKENEPHKIDDVRKATERL
jgi:hypothetical protein